MEEVLTKLEEIKRNQGIQEVKINQLLQICGVSAIFKIVKSDEDFIKTEKLLEDPIQRVIIKKELKTKAPVGVPTLTLFFSEYFLNNFNLRGTHGKRKLKDTKLFDLYEEIAQDNGVLDTEEINRTAADELQQIKNRIKKRKSYAKKVTKKHENEKSYKDFQKGIEKVSRSSSPQHMPQRSQNISISPSPIEIVTEDIFDDGISSPQQIEVIAQKKRPEIDQNSPKGTQCSTTAMLSTQRFSNLANSGYTPTRHISPQQIEVIAHKSKRTAMPESDSQLPISKEMPIKMGSNEDVTNADVDDIPPQITNDMTHNDASYTPPQLITPQKPMDANINRNKRKKYVRKAKKSNTKKQKVPISLSPNQNFDDLVKNDITRTKMTSQTTPILESKQKIIKQSQTPLKIITPQENDYHPVLIPLDSNGNYSPSIVTPLMLKQKQKQNVVDKLPFNFSPNSYTNSTIQTKNGSQIQIKASSKLPKPKKPTLNQIDENKKIFVLAEKRFYDDNFTGNPAKKFKISDSQASYLEDKLNEYYQLEI